MRRFLRVVHDQRGGTMIEYALICALVIVTMFVALNTFASSSIRIFNTVSVNAGAVL